MSATFARFFGADPSTLTPSQLLKAADGYWPRYFNFGRIQVAIIGGGKSAAITVGDVPREPLLAAIFEGSLGRIAELAGGTEVTVAQTDTVIDGRFAYRFMIKWIEEEHTPTPTPTPSVRASSEGDT